MLVEVSVEDHDDCYYTIRAVPSTPSLSYTFGIKIISYRQMRTKPDMLAHAFKCLQKTLHVWWVTPPTICGGDLNKTMIVN